MDISLNADLDGTILAYNYCAQLVYVMTFDYSHMHNFHLWHSQYIVRMSWV